MFKNMSLMTIVKDWFGLLAMILGAVAVAGFSVSAPWPAKADVESLEKNLSVLQQIVKDNNCLTLKLLLQSYQQDKENAEKDLKENPNSISAAKARDRAIYNIEQVQKQISVTCSNIQ